MRVETPPSRNNPRVEAILKGRAAPQAQSEPVASLADQRGNRLATTGEDAAATSAGDVTPEAVTQSHHRPSEFVPDFTRRMHA